VAADPATLAEPLRSAVLATIDEASTAGARVSVTSARRSREQQIALRRAHCGTSDYDVFQKPSSECKPQTARPGSSKHELGLAVDMGGDVEKFAQLGAKRGLVRPVRGEPWHFEHTSTAGQSNAELESEGYTAGGGGAFNTGGGGGLSVGGAVDAAGNVITAPFGAVLGGLDALKNLAEFVVNPRNWLRALGAVLGVVIVLTGLAVLGLDLIRGTAQAGGRSPALGDAAGYAGAAVAVA
jgi:hypothetical protein